MTRGKEVIPFYAQIVGASPTQQTSAGTAMETVTMGSTPMASPTSMKEAMGMSTSAMPMSMTTSASTSMEMGAMNSMNMPSSSMTSPQAGMATSMAEIKNMCSLPGMQQMCDNHTGAIIGICTFLLLLATLAVILRLVSRCISRLRLWWDDVSIVASLVFSYVCSALVFVNADEGVGKHFETIPQSKVDILLKTSVAYQILYCVTLTLIKISILLFYHRLFGVRSQFKFAVFIMMICVGGWCIAVVLLALLQCTPIKAAWIRPYPDSKCINNNASLIWTGVVNIILNLAILILPLWPIWSLALTLRQKITLTMIFLLGVFICVAAAVRVWAIRNIDQTDVTWSYARPLIWSTVEISVAITCACLPTLQPLSRVLFRRSLAREQSTTSSPPSYSWPGFKTAGQGRGRRNSSHYTIYSYGSTKRSSDTGLSIYKPSSYYNSRNRGLQRIVSPASSERKFTSMEGGRPDYGFPISVSQSPLMQRKYPDNDFFSIDAKRRCSSVQGGLGSLSEIDWASQDEVSLSSSPDRPSCHERSSLSKPARSSSSDSSGTSPVRDEIKISFDNQAPTSTGQDCSWFKTDADTATRQFKTIDEADEEDETARTAAKDLESGRGVDTPMPVPKRTPRVGSRERSAS